MLVVNTETVPGWRIVEIKGLVQGNTIRAKHAGKDIMAGFKNLVGGELKGYPELLTESRREATTRMIAQAQAIMAHDTRSRVGQITAPTLVLSAAEDILTPAAGGQELVEAIPGARFTVLPRGAHVTAAEYPAEVSAAILEFLLG